MARIEIQPEDFQSVNEPECVRIGNIILTVCICCKAPGVGPIIPEMPGHYAFECLECGFSNDVALFDYRQLPEE